MAMTFEPCGRHFSAWRPQIPWIVLSSVDINDVNFHLIRFLAISDLVKNCCRFFFATPTNFVQNSPNMALNIFRPIRTEVMEQIFYFRNCSLVIFQKTADEDGNQEVTPCVINDFTSCPENLVHVFRTITRGYTTNFVTVPPIGQNIQCNVMFSLLLLQMTHMLL